MRSFVLTMVATAALVLAGASQPATTAVTKTVKITATAFTPASVTIATGDAVKWTNTDTKTHQVVSNSGAFASPIIAAGKSYTHTFKTAGTYRYHDALHPALTGKVVVTGPPPAVTIGVVAARSMAGRKVYIQRFTRFHEWVKIRRVILGSTSARSFRLKLPRGRYVLRAYITVNQAGAGYLDGASRNIVYRVR